MSLLKGRSRIDSPERCELSRGIGLRRYLMNLVRPSSRDIGYSRFDWDYRTVLRPAREFCSTLSSTFDNGSMRD